MNKYTVIGFYEHTGLSFMDKTEANSILAAFAAVAKARPESTLVSAVAGHLSEGKNIVFPGECVVDALTILEDPMSFCDDTTRLPHRSPVIADFSMVDWKIADGEAPESLGLDKADSYRMVISQDVNLNRVFFNVYSEVFDDIRLSEPLNGLSGVIEIRNGKPAISLGLEECNLPIHIDSDVVSGLSIHTDSHVDVSERDFYSASHNIYFEANYYEIAETSWITAARAEIANSMFEGLSITDGDVVDSYSWECNDTDWSLEYAVETVAGGEPELRTYRLKFAEESTVVMPA